MSMGLQSAITPHGSPELYPLCLAGLWLTPNEGRLALSHCLGLISSLAIRNRYRGGLVAKLSAEKTFLGLEGSPLSSFHPLLCQNSAVATDNACEIQL